MELIHTIYTLCVLLMAIIFLWPVLVIVLFFTQFNHINNILSVPENILFFWISLIIVLLTILISNISSWRITAKTSWLLLFFPSCSLVIYLFPSFGPGWFYGIISSVFPSAFLFTILLYPTINLCRRISKTNINKYYKMLINGFVSIVLLGGPWFSIIFLYLMLHGKNHL